MISSMTGFGKGSALNSKMSVETEIKSVNNRFLEISLKLPKSLMNKEYEIREIVRKKIARGKLNISVVIRDDGREDNSFIFNKEKIEESAKFVRDIKKAAKIAEKVTLSDLLVFKDFFMAESQEENEHEFELVKQSLETALDELIVMRKKEGEQLSKDLKKRVNNIKQTVAEIEEISKTSVEEYFDKLKERIKMLVENSESYGERLELELALVADKADITEECVRLTSHVKFFLENLQASGDVGRKLNFLCQEINREANTIGSKCISTDVSHKSVFIKEELEKIREQIQNIE